MSGEKTHPATPKKLKDLRKKGTVARSIELPQAIAMVATLAMLPGALKRLSETLETSMITALSTPPVDFSGAVQTTATMIRGSVGALAPLLAAVALAGLLGSVVVTRSAPNIWVLKPRKERVSAKSGVKRMFSAQVVFELVRSVAKLGLLTAVAWGSWKAGYAALLSGPGTLAALIAIVREALGSMLVRIVVLAVAVGVVDAWWSRRRFNKQAKMSEQDIRDEYKTAEGNPEMKGKMRARASKLSRSRMMASIAGADVVLANPTHLVVALSYEAGTAAPVVVAKGAGGTADRIKAEAAKHGVPVIADKPLARAVYRASEIGDPIPAELYRAVAEVLATVYSTTRRSA